MVERKEYLDKLIGWKDEQVIKVVTGIRRCGKSTLLAQYQTWIKENGIADAQIVSINFEELEYEELLDYKKLYAYLKERLIPEKNTYIFLDEIQKVADFEKVVDSLYVKPNVDIYITGSNAYMLSGDLATLLTGRYVEIKMLPLSLKEFLTITGMDGAWICGVLEMRRTALRCSDGAGSFRHFWMSFYLLQWVHSAVGAQRIFL